MKLYYATGACSLADHIALHEAGVEFQTERVDLKTKITASGADFRSINPKGYVPALVLPSGDVITENVAVLDWIAAKYRRLGVDGALGRTRLLEALVFISSEIHCAFKPFWHSDSDAVKGEARATLARQFRHVATRIQGDFMFGKKLSVADCFLFVMLRWARRFDVVVPEALAALYRRMENRASVKAALAHEAALEPGGKSLALAASTV